MRIQSTGKVLVLAKNEREGQNRQRYYNLAVLINGEAGNLSCTEDAYSTAVASLENEVAYEYNSEYKSFRIISAQPERIPYNGNMYGTPEGSPAPSPEAKPSDKPETKADGKPDKPAK